MATAKNNRRWLSLIILGIGVGIVYQLPYIRETFYVPLQNAMHLSNEQMGLLSSGYATMATLSYFLGGIIADKFSARKLLTISFIGSGILGLYFATFPAYNISRIIFVLLGITTIITYWPALVKATRNLGTSQEQGRMFGYQEAVRGVSNTILVFGMQYVFTSLGSSTLGVAWAIRVCAIANLVVGVLTFIFLPDNQPEESESLREIGKGVWEAMKDAKVWMICGVIFTTYTMYGLVAYVGPYMVSYFGLDVNTSVTLGNCRYIIQIIGGIVGGRLADKIGSRLKVIIVGYVLVFLSYGLYLVIPSTAIMVPAAITNFVAGAFFIYIMRSLYFAVIDEAGVHKAITGRASGLASCVGYFPDVFTYTMVGAWQDQYKQAGYKMTFEYAMAMAVIGVILAIVLFKMIQHSKAKAAKRAEAAQNS